MPTPNQHDHDATIWGNMVEGMPDSPSAYIDDFSIDCEKDDAIVAIKTVIVDELWMLALELDAKHGTLTNTKIFTDAIRARAKEFIP